LLVVNADDFGFDPAINAAVERAHTDGILTSASLMVTGSHVEAAVEQAKRHPKLGVGIHLCLVRGRAVSRPEEIRGLAASDGSLPESLPLLSAKLAFSRRLEAAVATELRAQVERFLATGLQPTHLDTHMHTHIHPRVLEIVVRLAREYKVPFVRAPVEPLGTALRCGRHNLPRRLARWTIFGTLGRRARRRLRQQGVRTADRAVGVLDPGHLTEDFVAAYLEKMPDGLTEIFFHPAMGTAEELHRCQHGYRHAEELQALCSPRVRELIDRRGVRLVNFREMAGAAC
jgi:hopanoid biosynthesis associated protein HpnK